MMGHGELLFLPPHDNTPQWIQGINITPKELQQVVYLISRYCCNKYTTKFVLKLFSDDSTEESSTLGDTLTCSVARKYSSKLDQQLAEVILWALRHDSASINMLTKERSLGWNTASKLFQRLEELGIVDESHGKVRREIIPKSPEDIPEELMKFLENTGHCQDDVSEAICCRENDRKSST